MRVNCLRKKRSTVVRNCVTITLCILPVACFFSPVTVIRRVFDVTFGVRMLQPPQYCYMLQKYVCLAVLAQSTSVTNTRMDIQTDRLYFIIICMLCVVRPSIHRVNLSKNQTTAKRSINERFRMVLY